jgi:hypothetical protein
LRKGQENVRAQPVHPIGGMSWHIHSGKNSDLDALAGLNALTLNAAHEWASGDYRRRNEPSLRLSRRGASFCISDMILCQSIELAVVDSGLSHETVDKTQ